MVAARVVSAPRPGEAVLDCGSKTLSSDRPGWLNGFGLIVEAPEATIVVLSEEHAVVLALTAPLRVGDPVTVVPNHVCTVVNLTSELVTVDGDELTGRWQVRPAGEVRTGQDARSSSLALDPPQRLGGRSPLDDEQRRLLVEAGQHDLSDVGAETVALRSLGDPPAASARPEIFASPGHCASAPSTGSTVALCSANRGSRSRSALLRAFGIEPKASSPFSKAASIPEIRGDPSARKVAIVLCRRRRTAPARASRTPAPPPDILPRRHPPMIAPMTDGC